MSRLRIVDSFAFAFDGLKEALRTERNLRIDILWGFIVFFLCALLRIRGAERAILVALIFFVISFEIMNTAIETTVDGWMASYHALAKRAKDISAAAVLTSALGALGVGLLIVVPRMQTLFSERFIILSGQTYWLIFWTAGFALFSLWCSTHPLENKYIATQIDDQSTVKESD